MGADHTLAALATHLREEADFNRSWTDGRRGEADISDDYRARRLEVAAQREAWALMVELIDQRSPAEMSASSPSEASAGNLPQDEPNYKALYTELKGEVLEKVGPVLEETRRLVSEAALSGFTDEAAITAIYVNNGAITSALSSLHEKLSSIGGSSSTESAASLADGKLTAGEAQQKSEGDAA